MENHEIIHGTVEKFLFQNNENGFSIFILLAKSNQITVKGYLPSIQAGQEVQLKGTWIFHAKFGKQFEAKECITTLPTSVVGLKKYLGSGLIKGIGKAYAEKLVNYFGADILKIIDENPDRLIEVEGIGQKRIEKIISAWKDQKEIANLMVFLQSKGISPTIAAKIYKHYRQESIAILTENPYRLADELWGIGFKTADEIALKLGFEKHSPQRIASAILFTINNASAQGHLYVELQDLKDKTAKIIELETENKNDLLKNALHDLYGKDKIKLISENNVHYITLISFYYAEQSVCNKIKILLNYISKHKFDINSIYNNLRNNIPGEIYLNENQQKGVISCLQNKVTIITGGPGTGKTTLIKKLLNLLDKEKINYKLAAPTGRAAKRIIEGTGKYASTIHRLLEFDASTMKFIHNETNALKLDFLIVDEASMIDIFMMNSILKALPNNAHLILIGDIDQLPSVGPGNVLKDFISSQIIPYVRLTEIFRQAQDSLIIVNAHRINKGEFPVSNLPDCRRDFVFIKEDNQEEVNNHLKRILFIELKKRNISIDNTTILTPMNRGIIGTHALNNSLQELINPDKNINHITYAGISYKINDKVMQIRNNYDKQVYNGDIGIIKEIDHENKTLIINYDDKYDVEYEFDELNEIVLAYAISIHKSQGSEYDAVIVPIFIQHFMLLQRNLIYTALTRAKKLCIFIGQVRALAIALNNTKGTERLTFLKKFLTTQN